MKEEERMERRIFEAAVEGNLGSFSKIKLEDPWILDKVMLGVFRRSPLHLAALHGHDDFVTGVLDQKPELAEVVDCSQRQQSLLHLASARGLVKAVQKLVDLDPDLCLARDRDGRNPVHVAVMKGQVRVLEVLLEANSHAAQVVLDQAETILHLCVKRQKPDCLDRLVKKIRDKEFVNAKDDRGNTVLHLAVATKQLQVYK